MVTEVTSQSWFERIVASFKAVLIGGLLFLLSFVVLSWNEYRAVNTAQGIAEAERMIKSVPADKVDPANKSALIHFTAEAKTDETLKDPIFPVSANAIRLVRKVEMYQWIEKKESKEEKKLGGGTETVTTYTYKKEWESSPVNSENFKEKKGHDNPKEMPYGYASEQAEKVTAGAFTLSESLVGQMSTETLLEVKELPPMAPENMQLQANGYYLGADPASPAIGDVRIEFSVVKPAVVSIMAQQGDEGRLTAWMSPNKNEFERLMYGEKTAPQMIEQLVAENNMMTWVLRLVGYLMMAFGIMMFFGPITVLLDVLPILGDIAGYGVGTFAFVIAAVLSLITIGIAWLVVRPVLGVCLIGGAIVLLFAVRYLFGKKTPEPAAA